jgi:hypothetical protein
LDDLVTLVREEAVGVAELALERLELSLPDPQSGVLSKLNYRACNLMVECSLDKRVAVVRFHPGPSLTGAHVKMRDAQRSARDTSSI